MSLLQFYKCLFTKLTLDVAVGVSQHCNSKTKSMHSLRIPPCLVSERSMCLRDQRRKRFLANCRDTWIYQL